MILTELPQMNNDIDAARASPQPIIASWTQWFRDLADSTIQRARSISAAEAFALMQVADFPLASIERHAQRNGEQPGVAKSTIPDVDISLLMLGRIAGLPAPRGGVATYWLKNDEHRPLLFTGTSGEAAFTRAVIGMHRKQAHGYQLLEPICTGIVLLASEDAVTRLMAAATNAASVREMLLELWRRGADGERKLPVEVSTSMLRTYLTPYPVGGVLHRGPNAANIPTQIQHDLAVGVLAPFYRETVIAERLVYLDANDCADVVSALSHPSVLDCILEALDVADNASRTSSNVIAARLTARRDVIPAVSAFLELARACGRMWGTHLSQIHTYLTNAHREVPGHRLQDLPVPRSEGTGGHTHDYTERLMRMRRDDPVVRALASAMQSVSGSGATDGT